MRDQEIVNYLNSIDFSLVNDSITVDNILNEITPFSNELVCDPMASSSLEKLINISDSKNLHLLLDSIKKNLIYRKLGSRIFESIFMRLFNLMFIEKVYFRFQDFVDFIIPDECITCLNATHALRAVMMLLSGKKIEGKTIERFQILDYNTSDHVNESDAILTNNEYAKKKLDFFKKLFVDRIDKFINTDTFNTLGIFIRITRSQTLIDKVLKCDLSIDNIKSRSFFYEGICEVASKRNLSTFYNRIKNDIMDLSLESKSSYVIQAFLRNSDLGKKVLKRIDLKRFDEDSNIVLSLVESLQNFGDFIEVDNLIKTFYGVKNGVFEHFLLKKYNQLDTKYVNLIVNFMALHKRNNFQVNEDFVSLFRKEWLKSNAGIRLVFGYIEGSEDSGHKIRFFNENINLFWCCDKLKDGLRLAKLLLKNTQGHARKKAFEILSKCKTI